MSTEAIKQLRERLEKEKIDPCDLYAFTSVLSQIKPIHETELAAILVARAAACEEDTFKVANNLTTFNERLTFLLQETIRKKTRVTFKRPVRTIPRLKQKRK